MARLEGKVAMVTGSGGERGFGRVIARRLAAEGADLVLTDVEPTGVRAVPAKAASGWGGLPAVAAEVKGEGRRALTALADVRSAAQVETVVKRALQELGCIDILVNNAGAPAGIDRAPVVELSEEAWGDRAPRLGRCRGAGELPPEGGETVQRRSRERTLRDAGGRVLEMLQARVSEQHRGDAVGAHGQAQRRLHDALHVSFPHERAEHLCAPDVARVVRPPGDRLHPGRGDRVAGS